MRFLHWLAILFPVSAFSVLAGLMVFNDWGWPGVIIASAVLILVALFAWGLKGLGVIP